VHQVDIKVLNPVSIFTSITRYGNNTRSYFIEKINSGCLSMRISFFGGGSILWVIILITPELHFGATGAEVKLVLILSNRTGHQRFFVAFRKGFQSVCF